jgi:dTDP-4-dehydrorhamnose reductase
MSTAIQGPAMRCVVLGASGQLGNALLALRGNNRHHITGLSHADLDVTDRQAVRPVLRELRPDLVVNAAAYTAVDQAESDRERTFAVNRDGAGHIAEACAALAVPMIHVSTDYVFDGTKAEPYREDDPTASLSVYGDSKAAGEALIRERHDRAAIIRASWLFGVGGKNFVKTIAGLAQHRDELRIVADQRGCPTPAPDLAASILALGRLMIEQRDLAGVFHYAGAEVISWHGFAEAIVDSVAPFIGRRPRVLPIRTEDYPTAAQRPRNAVLDCRRLAMLGIHQRSWYPGLWDVVERLYEATAAPPQRKRA